MNYLLAAFTFALITFWPQASFAAVDGENAYILNTFLLLFCGALVMLMSAGFAMLEAGMVRSKSVAVILCKNVGIYAIAALTFYLVGYNLMFTGVEGGYFGTFSSWNADDTNALTYQDYSAGYASSAFWFFQMVFVGTAASIISGALAERIKIWPFLLFVTLMTALIYPVVGAWSWGGGWLSELGFKDFAGSTNVHSVGGWAALAGVILLGARSGRFNKNGESTPIAGASLTAVTLGAFLLWFGWFGFNGGSQLAFGSASDAAIVAKIFANTNVAAAAGLVSVIILGQLMTGRLDLPMMLNGALAGLVAITAGPDTPSMLQAIIIGSIGAVCMLAGTYLMEQFKLDDVVGAVPVHLFAGIWGTLAVPLTNPEATFTAQATGIGAVAAFVFLTSLILWAFMKLVMGIRLHWTQEEMGGDLSEMGVRAYNLEFGDYSSQNIILHDDLKGFGPAANSLGNITHFSTAVESKKTSSTTSKASAKGSKKKKSAAKTAGRASAKPKKRAGAR